MAEVAHVRRPRRPACRNRRPPCSRRPHGCWAIVLALLSSQSPPGCSWPGAGPGQTPSPSASQAGTHLLQPLPKMWQRPATPVMGISGNIPNRHAAASHPLVHGSQKPSRQASLPEQPASFWQVLAPLVLVTVAVVVVAVAADLDGGRVDGRVVVVAVPAPAIAGIHRTEAVAVEVAGGHAAGTAALAEASALAGHGRSPKLQLSRSHSALHPSQAPARQDGRARAVSVDRTGVADVVDEAVAVVVQTVAADLGGVRAARACSYRRSRRPVAVARLARAVPVAVWSQVGTQALQPTPKAWQRPVMRRCHVVAEEAVGVCALRRTHRADPVDAGLAPGRALGVGRCRAVQPSSTWSLQSSSSRCRRSPALPGATLAFCRCSRRPAARSWWPEQKPSPSASQTGTQRMQPCPGRHTCPHAWAAGTAGSAPNLQLASLQLAPHTRHSPGNRPTTPSCISSPVTTPAATSGMDAASSFHWFVRCRPSLVSSG